jgi:hypothetical protein
LKEKEEDRYTRNGYKNRNDYLGSLADNYGVARFVINELADILGPEEDFDGLVSNLEDFDSMGLLEGLEA